MTELCVGIDVAGGGGDRCVFAVCERSWQPVTEVDEDGDEITAKQDYYRLQYLEALDVGGKYPDIVDRLSTLIDRVQARQRGLERLVRRLPRGVPRVDIFIDATGLGGPVAQELDLVRGYPVTHVTFTATNRLVNHHDGTVSYGKSAMVHRLTQLLSTGRLVLPKGSTYKALYEELASYEKKQSAGSQRWTFNAAGNKFDDRVIAVALASMQSQGYGNVEESAIEALTKFDGSGWDTPEQQAGGSW